MRPSGSALLLALAACSIENPAFKAGPQGASGGGTTAVESTTTGHETDPDNVTTTTGPVTTADASSSISSSSTGEPVVTTGPVTASTTEAPGDLPHECDLTVVGDIKKYAYNVTKDYALGGCGVGETWRGKVSMKNGVLTVADTVSCETQGEHDFITLGEGYPTTEPDREFDCAEVDVFWHPAEPGMCRIGTMAVRILMPNPYFVYAASLNYPSQPPDFPLWPKRALVGEECGCNGQPGCCNPEDPGEYKFLIMPDHEILPDSEVQFGWMSKTYRFFNIQSYVDGTCQQASPQDPLRGQHFDWFGEEVQR